MPDHASDLWDKLTPYQHARRRTEMYFGAREPQQQSVLTYPPDGAALASVTWVPALFTAFREILDNALDEVVAHGHGDTIMVTYDAATLGFTVSDNGRGIPIAWNEAHQNYAATILMSEIMAGRNFAADRGATRGLNGVGAAVVNFCCDEFLVSIDRDGQHFEQRFCGAGDSLHTAPPTISTVRRGKQAPHGTSISGRLARAVFGDQATLPEQFVHDRMVEIAACYPALRLSFNGAPIVARTVEQLFPRHQAVAFTVEQPEFTSRFWLIPDFLADGGEHSHSLVNGIPAFALGVHMQAFRRRFVTGMLAGLERDSRKRRLTPIAADLTEGLLVYNMTQMAAPDFDSQSKNRLISETAARHIRVALDRPEFYQALIRRHPAWIDTIYRRCEARSQRRDRAAAIRLGRQNLQAKVEELEDACGYQRNQCILFIAEGKSAITGMVEVRDPERHGGLPLSGKILNVHGKSHTTILENLVLGRIMSALGLVPGQRANRHLLRYGQVYITTDADEDGKNIMALLVNFFYTLWPELFDPGKPAFLSVLDTPLIVAAKGKQRRYWYSDQLDAFQAARLGGGWEITRAKGLAALRREDWHHVLREPRLRPLFDDGRLKDALELLFNEAAEFADRRKHWIGLVGATHDAVIAPGGETG